MFQIVNGYEDIDRNMFFKLKEGSRTRGHKATLVKEQFRLDMRTTNSPVIYYNFTTGVFYFRTNVEWCGMEGRAYFGKDFVVGLSIGPFQEWFLCLKAEVTKGRLLYANIVKIKGYSFMIWPADQSQF